MTKLIPPDGNEGTGVNIVTTTYAGNCATVIDQAGKTRKSCSDALGRLTQVFEPDASNNLVNETDYQYDVLDNLTCVESHGNVTGTGCSSPQSSDATSPWRVRRFTYNSLSQLLSATNPESGTICYGTYSAGVCQGNGYDADGNLITKTAPAPNQPGSATVTATMNYDALHRVNQKSYSDGTTPTVKYGYDAIAPSGCTPPALTINNGIGRRTSMCDGSGAAAWSVDLTANQGWKTTEARTINGVTKTVVYQNNFTGTLTQLTYPSGRMITYAAGAAGRLLSAMDQGYSINYVLSASYAPQGALSSAILGQTGTFNGTNLAQAFNNRLQPTSIRASSTNGVALDLGYNFDLSAANTACQSSFSAPANNGDIAVITNNLNSARTQTFCYDTLNRVASARTSSTSGQYCWGETFGYDIWANLLSIGGITPQYSGCSQESGLSVGVTVKNQISGDSCDAAGNLLSGLGMGPFTYDAENHLKTAGGVTYTYDGDGKRVQKSSGKLYWYGMGGDPLDESDAAGNITDEYVFLGGKRVARRNVSSGNIYYYFADHLSTARIVTNATGTILDDSDFYPFGGERVVTSTSGNTYKFTGKERDTESGLDNFGARYDSSSIGRFMSPDPKPDSSRAANPQSLNRYSYALNNPLKYVDVRGECTAPALGPGQVGICIESYIQAARLGRFPSKNWLGLGDNRGPVANNPKATFRSQTLVTVDLHKHIVSQQSQAGVSEILFKGYHPESGIVVSGITSQSTDDKGNIHFGITVNALNGQAASGQTAAPQGWIEMHFEFQVDPNGRVVVTGGNAKTYPSVSIFSYSSDGSTNDLFEQRESGNPDDLTKPTRDIKTFPAKGSGAVQEDAQRQCVLGNPAACNF